MRRGEIWWAALKAPIGSEPGYRRPVIIVSNNLFNQRELRTVLTVPLTSNLSRDGLPGNVRVPHRHSGLTKTSIAVAIQVAATDRGRLLHRIGRVPDVVMADIDNALRLVLAL